MRLGYDALGLYRERFSATGIFENEPYSGIAEVLSSLRSSGVRLYVASSKPRVFVVRILQHFELEQYFEWAFGSELDGTRADKTELLRFALDESGTEPALATMVGDRAHDVIGAVNNGVDVVGVLYGYGSESELRRAGANRLVKLPADLISSLRT